jgi:sec-independent protein translocase protein TatB
MFELSFGKLVLIGVIALIVLGPERLPTVARTLGALVGRAQRFVASVKAEIQSEVGAAGLNSLRQELHDTASAFQQRIETEVRDVNQTVAQLSHEVASVTQAASPNLVQPGASQVTPAQLAALEAAHAEAGLSAPQLLEPIPPAVAAVEDDANYPLFAEAVPHQPPVNENQLDLFAPPPEAAKSASLPPHA